MFEDSRLLIDKKINRRTFMKRMTQAGVSVIGANALASHLVHAAEKPSSGSLSSPKGGRIIENMTGGEVVAELMVEWDVPYLFGLAGSEEVGLLDALVGRPIRYTTGLHEGVIISMADGYSRSTGQTPVIQLHSVAGSCYGLGQMVTSFKDNVPLVVTVGRQATNFRGHEAFLESVNLHMLPKEYTQWTWDVLSPETIAEVMRRAFVLGEAPPGGPTFVTFSVDLFSTRIGRTEIIPRSRSRIITEVVPKERDVSRIVNNLLNAEFPCVFIGNECIHHEISAEVAEISETLGAPVLNAPQVPAVFPNTHPHFIGELDGTASRDPDFFPRIDCFWSLGGKMFHLMFRPPQPLIKREAKIMHTSLISRDIGRNYPVDVATISDLKSTVTLVLEELRKSTFHTSAIRKRRHWIRDYVQKCREDYKEAANREWDSTPIGTSRLMLELNKVMDKSAYVVSELITSDAYTMRYLDFSQEVPFEKRRRNFHTTSGVLGWSVGASVGTAIGNPDKEVWCLTADGSFNFGVQGLWSAARYEAPVGFVVFNNAEYQAIRLSMISSKGKCHQTGQYIGANLSHPDIQYVKLAAGYGIEGERVEDPRDLSSALNRCKKAMQEGRPYLVDVKIKRYFPGNDYTYYDHYAVSELSKI